MKKTKFLMPLIGIGTLVPSTVSTITSCSCNKSKTMDLFRVNGTKVESLPSVAQINETWEIEAREKGKNYSLKNVTLTVSDPSVAKVEGSKITFNASAESLTIKATAKGYKDFSKTIKIEGDVPPVPTGPFSVEDPSVDYDQGNQTATYVVKYNGSKELGDKITLYDISLFDSQGNQIATAGSDINFTTGATSEVKLFFAKAPSSSGLANLILKGAKVSKGEKLEIVSGLSINSYTPSSITFEYDNTDGEDDEYTIEPIEEQEKPFDEVVNMYVNAVVNNPMIFAEDFAKANAFEMENLPSTGTVTINSISSFDDEVVGNKKEYLKVSLSIEATSGDQYELVSTLNNMVFQLINGDGYLQLIPAEKDTIVGLIGQEQWNGKTTIYANGSVYLETYYGSDKWSGYDDFAEWTCIPYSYYFQNVQILVPKLVVTNPSDKKLAYNDTTVNFSFTAPDTKNHNIANISINDYSGSPVFNANNFVVKNGDKTDVQFSPVSELPTSDLGNLRLSYTIDGGESQYIDEFTYTAEKQKIVIEDSEKEITTGDTEIKISISPVSEDGVDLTNIRLIDSKNETIFVADDTFIEYVDGKLEGTIVFGLSGVVEDKDYDNLTLVYQINSEAGEPVEDISYTYAEQDYLCFTDVAGDGQNAKIGYTSYLPSFNTNILYSTDNKESWNEWDGTTIELTDGQSLYVQNRKSYLATWNNEYLTFTSDDDSGKVAVSGNVNTLKNLDTKNNNYAFRCLFKNLTCLTDASELVLPSNAYGESSFSQMFWGCTSLTKAPVLGNATLTRECYSLMFGDCTSLQIAPALPAETLSESCYFKMFVGCTSLTQAPALPAQTLAEKCYSHMFEGCISLTQAPALPAQTLKLECYSYMFASCSSLKINENGTVGTPIFTCPEILPSLSVQFMFLDISPASSFQGTPEPGNTYNWYL